ncbi:MAG: LysE family transporter [Nitratireductor sp.]
MGLIGYLAYLLALGIAAAIPGPGVAAVIARALGTGLRRSIALISGIIAGDLVYLTLAVAGLASLAHAMPQGLSCCADWRQPIWSGSPGNSGMRIRQIPKSTNRRAGATG